MTIYEKYELIHKNSNPLIFYNLETDNFVLITQGLSVNIEDAHGKAMIADLGGISYLENLEYIDEFSSYYEERGISKQQPKENCICNNCLNLSIT